MTTCPSAWAVRHFSTNRAVSLWDVDESKRGLTWMASKDGMKGLLLTMTSARFLWAGTLDARLRTRRAKLLRTSESRMVHPVVHQDREALPDQRYALASNDKSDYV